MIVDEVLIIDDLIKESVFERRILRFALPAETELEILSVRDALERWPDLTASSKKIFVLIRSVDMLSRLYNCLTDEGFPGDSLPPVNLGLINFTDSKTLLTRAVYVDLREKEQLMALAAKKVEIYAQALPANEKTPVAPLLEASARKEGG
jgi:mannose/fructose/N-acetylgalactosamine-specific phosphotransferase system component IIB